MMPKEKFQHVQKNSPERVDRSGGHQRDWLLACRGEKPAWANFDYAGPLTEAYLLGNIAMKLNQKIEWDSEAMRITNCEAANQYVQREYRKGWEI